MNRKASLRIAALILTAEASTALAQSKVESGILKAVPIMVGVGMALATVMLVMVGWKFASGDPAAKDSAKSTLVGAVFILSASTIAGLLKSWFS
ncbi:hypothetical protein HUA74_43995 [Myxococcus sp. CA051A]|uniref:TrbC/VirB2 family protein n=1 Tax=Myxococcus sp. CA051A TaxID=2741739 RepID=UPI00157B3EDF|nr:TrbC/VirB2 family protein [Myxococcus sp. CA051A]NTX67632.1 hypothetical protein [Myxococcus sp. CA051A]